MNKKSKTIITIVLFALVAILFLPIVGASFLFLSFENLPLVFIVLPFLLIALIFMLIWFKKERTFLIVFFSIVSVFSLFSLSFLGIYVYKKIYIPSITIKEKPNGNVYEFLPFEENSLVAKLEEESSLKLNDAIPVLDGATALFPVYSSFARACFPKDRCTLNEEGSALFYRNTVGSYNALIDGDADLIFCAAPSKEQVEYAQSKNLSLKLTAIGKEAFVFFVNKANPIDSISSRDLRKIYSGEIKNWKELGGPDLKIKAFQRAKNSGSQSTLEKFMGDIPLMKAPSDERIDFMGGIVEQVQNYQNRRNSIGFSFRYFINEMQNAKDVKIIKVDGVAPTVENIKNGSYPLASYFYAISTEKSKNVEALLNWILSEQGQYLIEKTGYVGLQK